MTLLAHVCDVEGCSNEAVETACVLAEKPPARRCAEHRLTARDIAAIVTEALLGGERVDFVPFYISNGKGEA